MKKGAKVYLEGQLQTRKWQDQSGQDRYSTEVVLQGFNGNLTMLDGRSEGGGNFGGQQGSGQQGGDFGGPGGSGNFGGGQDRSAPPGGFGGQSSNKQPSNPPQQGGGFRDEMDDDIPF